MNKMMSSNTDPGNRRRFCKRGHEMTEANSLPRTDGYLACRACRREGKPKAAGNTSAEKREGARITMTTQPPSTTTRAEDRLALTIPERIQELEEARGVTQDSHPAFRAFTRSPKKWLFVLEWCDPDVIVVNQKAWAAERGFARSELTTYLLDPRVKNAIEVLDRTVYSAKATNVLKKVYDQAVQGCRQSQKMILERYRPIGTAEEAKVDTVVYLDMTGQTQQPEETPANPQASLPAETAPESQSTQPTEPKGIE